MANHQGENDEQDANVREVLQVKEILETGITGKVKWFNVKLGYGFVCRDDNNEDIFIHQSAIVKSNPDHLLKSVKDGEEILFDIVKGTKGNESSNVSGLGGNCVKGSEFALRYPRMRGRGRGSFRGRGRSRMESNESGMRTKEFVRGGGRGRPTQLRRPNAPSKQVKNEDNEVKPTSTEKPVIHTGITGKVKWFNVKRGYGFVCRNDNEEDIFIHQSAIAKSNPDHPRKSVENGEEILFDIVLGDKGNEAANVSAVDGNCVKGSEYALRYARGRGRWRSGGRGISRGRNERFEDNRSPEYFRDGPSGRPYFLRGGPFRGGRPFPMGRPPFRGGRPPFIVPYVESYSHEVPRDYYYDIDKSYNPMRVPRGRFNGPRFETFSNEYSERRGGPQMGAGRPRGRGRRGGRGVTRGGPFNNSKDGEQQQEPEQPQNA